MKELEIAKEYLSSGEYTCVLVQNEQVRHTSLRGVKPLVEWLQEANDCVGGCAADKVVGRAAAFLYVLMGVEGVYAQVISIPALNVLKDNGIYVEYGSLAEHIINRRGDGICPFEEAVLQVDKAEQAYDVILQKMQEMGIK